jgi:glycosyltransferase involved in cell wall biosynthesis
MNDARKLNVAILCPAWFPVPPDGYGGIEAVVAQLADGLVKAGHEVTLFASGDSETEAELVSVYDRAPSEWIGHSEWELRHSLECYERAAEFDVISDHTGPTGIALSGLVETPVVHTVHGPLTGRAGAIYEQLAALVPNLNLISLSINQRSPKPYLPWLATCPNALDLSLYPCKPHRGDYLLFLGRMSPDKGCHHAISVAKELGLPLKIAAKKQEPAEEAYYDEYIAPHVGSDGIEFLGEVNHEAKVELLQDARVTLFPIDWEEPFGLVMIESMACGTPVIATNRGAVPEVIEHRRSGIIVEDYREMAGALAEADALDPRECRRYVEERFSTERMVDDYVRAYRAAVVGGAEPVSASVSQ